MNKIIMHNGYCPKLNKDYSITIEYIDSSTLKEKAYIKGLANCKYAGNNQCEYIENKKCPLYNSNNYNF
ncbi:MAG: hypothetical protein K0R72_951 [Clostridia bacterium]|jgi:hypothetical protein|nr:hypothetical protein [Clostridia bacterium]